MLPSSLNPTVPDNHPLHVLSGATSDIGLAIALRLVRDGRHVAALGRDPGALAQLQEQGGAAIETYCVDLANDAAIVSFATELIASGRPVAALIHCAGAHSMGAIGTTPVADMD